MPVRPGARGTGEPNQPGAGSMGAGSMGPGQMGSDWGGGPPGPRDPRDPRSSAGRAGAAPPAVPRPRSGWRTFGLMVLTALVAAAVAGLVAFNVGSDGSTPAATDGPLPPPLVLEGEQLDIGALLTKAQPSVVTIQGGGNAGRGVFGGAGSGVIISDDGLVLTNAHVLGNAPSAQVTLFDGSTRDAVLVGGVPADDIALIAMVDPPSLIPADLGNSADTRVGDSVVAIGNALGLGGTPSVTLGIVSAKDRIIQAPGNLVLENLIQTDAAINRGNSGGPLLNARGQVVGINTAIIPDAQNIGFAIAIDAVKPLIDEILSGGGTIRGDQAFLGVVMVAVEDLLEATREQYDVTADTGVFVTEITPESGAEIAGLELADVILEVDGQPVRVPSDVSTIIRSRQPGDSVRLLVDRGGEELVIEATLQARSEAGS